MSKQISDEFLRVLRNDVPIDKLITNILKIPTKESEGYTRFLCPLCLEFRTAIKLQTNLARCFRCHENFNPIDMVILERGKSFIEAVNFLKPLVPVLKQKRKPR